MTRRTDLSEKLFAEAQTHFPGGVNSPVRAFKSVGGTPRFIVRGKGSTVVDADGNEYIDFVGSWGPAVLGHAHPEILRALFESMKNGLSFGAPTPGEIQLARMVKERVPSIEMIRFVSSGTEACLSAIRVARGFTGRDKIIKFDGCYHGHADYLLVKAGSGAATCGVPDSSGVPADFAKHTLTARYNDLASVAECFKNNPDVACVIVEPVVGNMGCIPPNAGFLSGLRELCDKNGALLILDEVMTGFRVARGGAQELYNIKPDLSCFGKIIGGGLPVGAYGGRKDVMSVVAPLGPVYQAGTLSGNPLAMAVGSKTLELLTPACYSGLEQKAERLAQGFANAAKEKNVAIQINRVGSMVSFFLSDQPVVDADSARLANRERFAKIFHHFLDNGIYWPPSPFEAAFLSLSHSQQELDRTVEVFAEALSL